LTLGVSGFGPTISAVALRDRAGTDEVVITGRATFGVNDVALIVGEFAFLGGSIGPAATDPDPRCLACDAQRSGDRR